RQEPSRREKPAQLGEFRDAADEARQLYRQVVRKILEGVKRCVAIGHSGMPQLEDALGPAQVLEPVQSEVDERRVGRQTAADEIGGCTGYEHLPSGADRTQARATDDRGPEVVPCVAQLDFAGVDRHPYPELR